MRYGRIKSTEKIAYYYISCQTAQNLDLFDPEYVRDWIYARIVALATIYYVHHHAICVLSNQYQLLSSMHIPELELVDLEARYNAYQSLFGTKDRPWHPDMASEWHARLTDLSSFMKDLNQSVAVFVNRVNHGMGHVFRDRFKSCLLETGPSLLACLAFVDCSSLREGNVREPGAYEFCSIGRFRMRGRRAAGVSIPPITQLPGLKPRARHKAYAALIGKLIYFRYEPHPRISPTDAFEAFLEDFDVEEIINLVFQRTKWLANSLVVGSKAFCEPITKKILGLTNPRLRALSNKLFTNHQRAGPYSR